VNMVGHQTERVHFTFKFLFPLGEVVEVIAIVVFAGKYRLPVMSALHDVMGSVGDDDALGPGHDKKLPSGIG